MVNPTSLPTNRAAGNTGLVTDANTVHTAVNAMTAVFDSLVARIAALEAAPDGGGNAYTILGASSARVNPNGGGPLPANACVTWIADTKPAAMLDDRDIWYIPAS